MAPLLRGSLNIVTQTRSLQSHLRAIKTKSYPDPFHIPDLSCFRFSDPDVVHVLKVLPSQGRSSAHRRPDGHSIPLHSYASVGLSDFILYLILRSIIFAVSFGYHPNNKNNDRALAPITNHVFLLQASIVVGTSHSPIGRQ